jgi:hypothetical protein
LTLAMVLERIKPRINNARAEGKALSVAYVNEAGRPVVTLRGSAQIYSDHEFCIWLRNAEGGFARALRTHPGVALLYRDEDARTTLMFEGLARIDPAARDEIYARTPPREQGHDPDKRGTGVIVDIDRVRALYGKVPHQTGRSASFTREWRS